MTDQDTSQESSKAKKKAYVDEDTCIGCALCTQIAPGTFAMKENGKSQATGPHSEPEETIQNAINSCPVQCISWKE